MQKYILKKNALRFHVVTALIQKMRFKNQFKITILLSLGNIVLESSYTTCKYSI